MDFIFGMASTILTSIEMSPLLLLMVKFLMNVWLMLPMDNSKLDPSIVNDSKLSKSLGMVMNTWNVTAFSSLSSSGV
jgi:hypothetical protein